MAQDVFASSAAARRIFELADAALEAPLTQLMFEGPTEQLTLTHNAQPAILTASIALLEALKEAVPDLPPPACAAGHSLGEYSALVASGALAFTDAVRLVRVRGTAMQSAVPAGAGSMAAIMGGDEDTIRALCREVATREEPVSPANFNAPGQIVVAGTKTAVERLQDLAKERKLRAIPLAVSAPFHCALMQPAVEPVQRFLRGLSLKSLQFPVISNVDARPNQDPTRVAELLERQITSPVLWQQSVQYLAQLGIDQALELGPGRVLAGLVKRTSSEIKVHSVGDVESLAQVSSLLVQSRKRP